MRARVVLVAMAAAVLALVQVTATHVAPLGLPDHVAALAIGVGATGFLCARAGRTLVDPISLR
jgi:hypothetical protein